MRADFEGKGVRADFISAVTVSVRQEAGILTTGGVRKCPLM